MMMETLDKKLNAQQLLYYQAPLSAVVVLACVPVFDNYAELREYEYSSAVLFWIVVTAVLAFCVNLSIYLVIGNTSPITYNVLGHFKLCVILFSGWIFFNEDMNRKKLIGIVMAFFGVVLYTHLKQNIENEWNRRPTTAAPAKTDPSDRDDAQRLLSELSQQTDTNASDGQSTSNPNGVRATS